MSNKKPSTTHSKREQRDQKILDVVAGYIQKEPDKETFEVDLAIFSSKDPLLRDKTSLENAFDRINDKAKGLVTLSLGYKVTGSMMTAGEEGSATCGYETVEIHIEEPTYILNPDSHKERVTHPEPIKHLAIVTSEHIDDLRIVVNHNYSEGKIFDVSAEAWKICEDW